MTLTTAAISCLNEAHGEVRACHGLRMACCQGPPLLTTALVVYAWGERCECCATLVVHGEGGGDRLVQHPQEILMMVDGRVVPQNVLV